MRAIRLFCQIIAADGKRSCPAAHADFGEFAAAAFAGEVGFVAQVGENFAVAPDLRQGSALHVAAADGEVAAGKDFAGVRDETDRLAGEAAFAHGRHIAAGMAFAGRGRHGTFFGPGSLAHHAEIVRSARRFQM